MTPRKEVVAFIKPEGPPRRRAEERRGRGDRGDGAPSIFGLVGRESDRARRMSSGLPDG